MKKTLTLLLLTMALCLSPLAARAQAAVARTVERTYIATDRGFYIAGDNLWCSAFCVNVATGRLSDLSSVVYLELHSASGVALTAKIALDEGRGGGCIALPPSLPTGSYRLIAYTAQNRNEADYDFTGIAAKTLSICNAFSRERVEGGVEVVSEAVSAAPLPGCEEGPLLLFAPAEAAPGEKITLTLNVPEDATVSVSVCHEDGLPHGDNASLGGFLAALPAVGSPRMGTDYTPEYEGEIIHGHIAGFSPEKKESLIGKFAFISAPGNKADIYCSEIDTSGRLTFYTGNIYGRKELITEIEGIDTLENCHVELESPFVEPALPAPAPMRLSASMSEAVSARAMAMQIERRFASDTLLEYLPRRDNLLFEESLRRSYHLDDYTRFPVMREVFIEFIPELRARENEGVRDIQVRVEDGGSDPRFYRRTSLTLLDGVPVFDQNKIYNYDPALVENIDIYPYIYFVGKREFGGIVNFVTYKRNLPSIRFSGNVRVVNYQGVLYPTAYTCETASGDYPDYRQTAFWHPLVSVRAGKPAPLTCKLPGYAGTFTVTVEGMTAAGAPILVRKQISVR